jgi:UDP-glucuronate decarboxylase
MNKTLDLDLEYTWNALNVDEKRKLSNCTILITGCGGFLGQYYLSFFEKYQRQLNIKKIIGIDSFLLGVSPLIRRLKEHPIFDIREMDVKDFSNSDILGKYEIDYVLHMASIASPTYYRKHPLETIDSNIWGIRVLLEAFAKRQIKGFLFYSSSEVYGNPDAAKVPTTENYWGNVSCIGPRACYDESKRFGETLCWIFHKIYNMPIRIVRLFNVYGPGLKINDRRAPADFAQSIVTNTDIVIFSNGQPTRTFCYVADSVIEEIKALLSNDFDVFNIGSSSEEMTILQLAELFRKIGKEYFGYNGKVIYKTSVDKEYLVHDPQRRCPDISKAKEKLGYLPMIEPQEGIHRYLQYLQEEGKKATW